MENELTTVQLVILCILSYTIIGFLSLAIITVLDETDIIDIPGRTSQSTWIRMAFLWPLTLVCGLGLGIGRFSRMLFVFLIDPRNEIISSK